MIFVERLLHHPDYQDYLNKLEGLEAERIYCKHSFEHFLDVARIGCLITYEDKLSIDKESFYLCALLHDLGRVDEYLTGQPHDEASQLIAKKLLDAIDFPKEKQLPILDAIAKHRIKAQAPSDFSGLLAKADKLSRNCFYCKAKASCYWSDEKKNKTIYY